MKTSGYIILLIILIIDIFEIYLTHLNLKQLNLINTYEIDTQYNTTNLENSIKYQREKISIKIWENIIHIPIFFSLFIFKIIQTVSVSVTTIPTYEFMKAFILFVIFYAIFAIIDLPFNIYDTFHIEKHYGFSNISIKLFIKDIFMQILINMIMLLIILFGIIEFIQFTGHFWWIYASIFIVVLNLFVAYIYPTFIAPLFNKFTPLTDDILKMQIKELFEKTGFYLNAVYIMDASKRSSHTNAYFAGLGTKKRVVLFDTLVKKYSKDNIISIIAHELGHYKLKHILKTFVIIIPIIILGLFLISLFLNTSYIYEIFGFHKFIFIGIFITLTLLFPPISFIIKPFLMFISRKHEYEADKFAIQLTRNKQSFKEALIKLYQDNSSHPLPHVLYTFFNSSHPPLKDRIKATDKTIIK